MIRIRVARPPLGTGLRAAAMAAGALVLCWPLTRASGLLAAAIGAALGSLLGTMAARSHVRTGPLTAAASLVGGLGVMASDALVRSVGLAQALGPLRARSVAEMLLWGALCAATVFILRVCAARVAWMTVLELAVMAGALAASLAAHREGMVHRPLALADWALSHGRDPVVVLLALGGLASLVLAALLLREERRRRVPLHLAGLALLALLLAMMVRVTGVPEPRAASDMGLTGKPKDGQGQQDKPRPHAASPDPNGSPLPVGEGEDPNAKPREQDRPEGTKGGQGQDAEMPFRDEYSAQGGQAPVAVVVFHDDYSPPSGVYYFRQSAFSQYNGIRLVESTREDVDTDIVGRFPTSTLTLASAPATGDSRVDVRVTVGLLADHYKPFVLDAPAQIWPIENPDRLRFRRAYGVLSHASTLPYQQMLGHAAGLPGWTADQLAEYTAWPRKDARYRELAETILDTLPVSRRDDPLAKAIAVKMWLDDNGIYSRHSQHAYAPDPTADFLFGDKTGYCVHFAHAAAFLLRALDVPTRVAGGYAVEEGRRGSGSALMIRGLDAHAWPEIALDGVGWVVVDPQPRRTLDPPGQEADTQLQQMLGEALRKSGGRKPDDGDTGYGLSMAAVWRFLKLLALTALVAAVLLKVYRAAIPGVAAGSEVYRVGYRAALDRLAEVGLVRERGETREAFAARAAKVSPSFPELTRQHLAVAMGSQMRPPAPNTRRVLRAVVREVWRAVPRWRAAVSVIDPLSWLRAR